MRWIYAGSRTTRERQARGAGLTVFSTTDDLQDWQLVQTLEFVNPSFLITNASGSHFYVVHGDQQEVSALRRLPDGKLELVVTRSISGRNPVHLALTPDQRFVLVANYATGSLSTLPIADDGALADERFVLMLPGKAGPNQGQQRGSHPHQVVAVPGTDRFVVPDKGADRLHLVRVTPSGEIQLLESVVAAPGAGPRHACVGTGQLWLVNELHSTLTTYRLDGDAAVLQPLVTTALLPDGFDRSHQAAGIARDGASQTVYVSNRGHDSISVLQPDLEGRLAVRQWVPTLGQTPRFILLDDASRSLLVANEGSHNWVRIPVLDDGRLAEPSLVATTGSPVCAVLLPHSGKH